MRVQDVQTQDDNWDALVRVWGSSARILLVTVLLLGWRALRALSSLLRISCRVGGVPWRYAGNVPCHMELGKP